MRIEKIYNINYNDGVYYGTIKFYNKTKKQIKKYLLSEIKDNNKTSNKNYCINFKNIKRVYN